MGRNSYHNTEHSQDDSQGKSMDEKRPRHFLGVELKKWFSVALLRHARRVRGGGASSPSSSPMVPQRAASFDGVATHTTEVRDAVRASEGRRHGDDDPMTTRTTRAVSRRVLPWLFLTSTACYLDRGNVAFAAAQLERDLGFSRRVYGIGSGVFFASYVLLEVPSNIAASRVGPAKWLSRILITWGLAASSMALTRDAGSFYATRLLLGAAEAGAYPAMIVALTRWFGHEEFPSKYASVCQGSTLGCVLGGPLAVALLALDGVMGLKGWQWLFVVEGVPAVVLGLAMYAYLPEGPLDARCTWLSEREKVRLRSRVEEATAARGAGTDEERCRGRGSGRGGRRRNIEGGGGVTRGRGEEAVVGALGRATDVELSGSGRNDPASSLSLHPSFMAGAGVAGRSWRVWYFAVQWFFAYNAYYGILFFGPLLIGDVLHPKDNDGKNDDGSRHTEAVVLWLATVPYIFAGVCVQANAAWCERTRAWRLHASLPLGLAAAALFVMPRVAAAGHRWLAFVLLVVSNGGVWSAYGPLGGQWQGLHAGEAGAAALAVINSAANVGGMFGPIVLGLFENTVEGLSVLAVLLVMSAIMVAAYPPQRREVAGAFSALIDDDDDDDDDDGGETLMTRGVEKSSG